MQFAPCHYTIAPFLHGEYRVFFKDDADVKPNVQYSVLEHFEKLKCYPFSLFVFKTSDVVPFLVSGWYLTISLVWQDSFVNGKGLSPV